MPILRVSIKRRPILNSIPDFFLPINALNDNEAN
jgi:hypothetical protein